MAVVWESHEYGGYISCHSSTQNDTELVHTEDKEIPVYPIALGEQIHYLWMGFLKASHRNARYAQ